jgi:hypothetical protein
VNSKKTNIVALNTGVAGSRGQNAFWPHAQNRSEKTLDANTPFWGGIFLQLSLHFHSIYCPIKQENNSIDHDPPPRNSFFHFLKTSED